MEQKHVLLSALSVGVGLGVGLGLSTGQVVQNWVGGDTKSNEISGEQIVLELKNIVVDGKNSTVTFDDFPYYLSERVRVLLTSAGYVHLKQQHFSKHMRNLLPASKAILLYGPAEPYHQKLAQALAHCFESKLLLLDVTDFSLKMQRKYGCSKKEPYFKRSISEVTLERISDLFGSLSILPSTGTLSRQNSGIENSSNSPKLRRNASNASESSSSSENGPLDPASFKCASRFCFDEKLFVQSLYEVLVSMSETGSIILYIKDVEKLFLRSPRIFNLFQKLLKKLSGSVLILGSRIYSSEDDCTEVGEKLTVLFPYNIEIEPPQDETRLGKWKTQLAVAMKLIQFEDNRNHIAEVLAENDIDCNDLDSICHDDTDLLSDYIEEIVVSAISHHLMDTKHPEYRNGKLIISAKSLSHVLKLFREGGSCGKDNTKTKESSKEVPSDNEYEKRIRAEVIPAKELGVTFADIGALDDIKESLQELVILPLRRPDLFKGDGLLKPCRGILLFGPPGTGKTMLAKAIANEAGASFINVSISTITSKWFGEDEKNVRALFSLAAKVAPTIIFIDEVDSMLGQRSRYCEHEAMRKIKNEFMTHWDGLLSKAHEQVLVLAATNRPFDLDEAIIRRFQRRIMVGLPSAETREVILKTLLAKEKYENIDFKELSTMTEGYTASDLKNLCMTAAYQPLRELMRKERAKEMVVTKSLLIIKRRKRRQKFKAQKMLPMPQKIKKTKLKAQKMLPMLQKIKKTKFKAHKMLPMLQKIKKTKFKAHKTIPVLQKIKKTK
ncbi:P-loop containing nucleoside triphosphate hydrolase [Sesbania bispinosa]|nr:P-loop containing nucleoside triphosphate hydrolase [Sesbania bispinosa]